MGPDGVQRSIQTLKVFVFKNQYRAVEPNEERRYMFHILETVLPNINNSINTNLTLAMLRRGRSWQRSEKKNTNCKSKSYEFTVNFLLERVCMIHKIYKLSNLNKPLSSKSYMTQQYLESITQQFLILELKDLMLWTELCTPQIHILQL